MSDPLKESSRTLFKMIMMLSDSILDDEKVDPEKRKEIEEQLIQLEQEEIWSRLNE